MHACISTHLHTHLDIFDQIAFAAFALQVSLQHHLILVVNKRSSIRSGLVEGAKAVCLRPNRLRPVGLPLRPPDKGTNERVLNAELGIYMYKYVYIFDQIAFAAFALQISLIEDPSFSTRIGWS